MNIVGYILIFIGILLVAIGTLGLYKYRDFYSRILLSSQIDTIGFIFVMGGIIFIKGFSFFSLKVLVIIIIALIISPLNTHAISRSAYKSGYHRGRSEKSAD